MKRSVNQKGTVTYRNSSGQLHRDNDLPAVIEKNGYRAWCQNGEWHRENGPARIYADGDEEWWQNGLRHRVDGPARIWPDGLKEWWVHGEKHRIDGPAIIYDDGSESWYINSKDITGDVNEWITENNISPWQEWTVTEKILFSLRFR